MSKLKTYIVSDMFMQNLLLLEIHQISSRRINIRLSFAHLYYERIWISLHQRNAITINVHIISIRHWNLMQSRTRRVKSICFNHIMIVYPPTHQMMIFSMCISSDLSYSIIHFYHDYWSFLMKMRILNFLSILIWISSVFYV